MKVDLSAKITFLDGSPVVWDEKTKKPLTVKSAALFVLQHPDERATLDEKMERSRLAMRLYDVEGETDLKSKDVVLLKDLVQRFFLQPLIVCRFYDLIEPESEEN